jgi:hypothetical protein
MPRPRITSRGLAMIGLPIAAAAADLSYATVNDS